MITNGNESVQGFGYLKIPVSTYFFPPDDVDALEYLISILNHHTIHSVTNGTDPYSLNLLDCKNEIAASVKVHDIEVEWEMIYDEN